MFSTKHSGKNKKVLVTYTLDKYYSKYEGLSIKEKQFTDDFETAFPIQIFFFSTLLTECFRGLPRDQDPLF